MQVFYYSNGVFIGAGIPEDYTPYAVLGTGVINVLVTGISVSTFLIIKQTQFHWVAISNLEFFGSILALHKFQRTRPLTTEAVHENMKIKAYSKIWAISNVSYPWRDPVSSNNTT